MISPPLSRPGRGKPPRAAIWGALLLLGALVLLSRVPFLAEGYGENVDAWRVANAARVIAEEGRYEASRLPGYPLHEAACALVYRGGPIALNGLSAVASACCAMLLAGILRTLRLRLWWLGALAFAMVPIVYVNSVTAKDFLPALALLLGAFLAALNGRFLLAGACLGLATGFRITSCAAAVPLAMLLVARFPVASRTGLVRFLGTAAALGALSYLPVFATYGSGFFTFAQNHAFPDVSTIVARGTLEVFGTVGLAGVTAGIAGILWQRRISAPRRPEQPASAGGELGAAETIAFLVQLALTVVMFTQLPDQAGYLIVALPFVVILFAAFCHRAFLWIACGLLILSPFAEWRPPARVSPGAILEDRSHRRETSADIRRFLEFAEMLPGHLLILVGAWEPEIRATTAARDLRHRYLYLLERDHLEGPAWEAASGVAFASGTVRQFNRRVTGLDPATVGAVDLQPVAAAWWRKQQANP